MVKNETRKTTYHALLWVGPGENYNCKISLMLLNDKVSLIKYIMVAFKLNSAKEWLSGTSDNTRQCR